jgi:Ca2+-binding RTX toxin-like protein
LLAALALLAGLTVASSTSTASAQLPVECTTGALCASEGSLTLNLTFSGQANCTWTVDVNWGDGSTDTDRYKLGRGTNLVQISHRYASEGSYSVTYTGTGTSPRALDTCFSFTQGFGVIPVIVPTFPTHTCGGLMATQVGDNGPNILTGTSGTDVFVGLGGNDTIRGKGGDDFICAGGGKDTVNGGAGNDYIEGGKGKDKLNGAGGNDILLGGSKADKISGKKGNDVAWGGGGNDTLLGGSGEDGLYGQRGRDRINGGPGTDNCSGGAGVDTVTSC